MRKTFNRRGLAMTEALISLAICATLLTAVGAGFVGATNAIENNDDFSRCVQSARVCLLHMEDEVRTGTPDPTVTVDGSGNATSFRVITADLTNPDRTYKYSSSAQEVLLSTNTVSTDPDFIVARHVTSCRFAIQKGTDSGGATCVSQIGITLTITLGNNSVTLSGSASPRKSLPK